MGLGTVKALVVEARLRLPASISAHLASNGAAGLVTVIPDPPLEVLARPNRGSRPEKTRVAHVAGSLHGAADNDDDEVAWVTTMLNRWSGFGRCVASGNGCTWNEVRWLGVSFANVNCALTSSGHFLKLVSSYNVCRPAFYMYRTARAQALKCLEVWTCDICQFLEKWNN